MIDVKISQQFDRVVSSERLTLIESSQVDFLKEFNAIAMGESPEFMNVENDFDQSEWFW